MDRSQYARRAREGRTRGQPILIAEDDGPGTRQQPILIEDDAMPTPEIEMVDYHYTIDWDAWMAELPSIPPKEMYQ